MNSLAKTAFQVKERRSTRRNLDAPMNGSSIIATTGHIRPARRGHDPGVAPRRVPGD